jgi:nicotinamide mononucleotide transporter
MSSVERQNFSHKENVSLPPLFDTLPSMDSSPAAIASPTTGSPRHQRATWLGLGAPDLLVMLLTSALVLAASYRNWWAIGVAEAWGFVTGGICVWLVVREHLWNWPVGLVNNIFFFVLFLRGRLYADMSLQIVYLALGVYGWLNWIFGGKNRTALKISRTSRSEWILLTAAIPLCTVAMQKVLISVNDAAPVWDALTTVLSLAAQYLLCRKRFENWWFWIAADVIYIPLYFSRQLPLTAILYTLFLAMCVVGVREWTRSVRKGAE